MPILYAVLATMFSFVWVSIAWKLGWTELDPNANLKESFSDIRRAIREKKEKAMKKKADVQDINTLTVIMNEAEEEGKNKKENDEKI